MCLRERSYWAKQTGWFVLKMRASLISKQMVVREIGTNLKIQFLCERKALTLVCKSFFEHEWEFLKASSFFTFQVIWNDFCVYDYDGALLTKNKIISADLQKKE